MTETRPFHVQKPWEPMRPHVLVVACSDGRLQEPLDDFLNSALGIVNYDRLYLPGGPASLSPSASEYTRLASVTKEFHFLLDAHQIETVILTYHCSAEDGPEDAVCADYRRMYASYTAERIRKQQELDTEQILKGPLSDFKLKQILAYRMEVGADYEIDVKSLI